MFKSAHVSGMTLLATLVAGLFLLVVSAAAYEPREADQLPPGASGCGTQERYELEVLSLGDGPVMSPEACSQNGSCDDPTNRDSYLVDPGDPILYIRLMVHVLAETNGSAPISTDEETWDHINRLNADYAPYNIQFVAQINHVNNSVWRSLAESEINDMKEATAIAPDQYLNVWATTVEFSYSFGTFPWSSWRMFSTGGIVMGGFHWVYGPTSTFAHEVGHCLGLWHTFHGVTEQYTPCLSCYEYVGAPDSDVLGDFCSDTPATPEWGSCSNASGTDECSGEPWGYTMPENFMGYTSSTCRTMFTAQQVARMRCWSIDRVGSWIIPFYVTTANTFGPVPLDVDFQGFTHKAATSWDWDFGEGGSSGDPGPLYTYDQPGYHTVSTEMNTASETFLETYPGMISAYADTLRIEEASMQSPISQLQVYARNYLPLSEIVFSITWVGPIPMRFDSVTTTGLRTSYFETPSIPAYDLGGRRAAIKLVASNDGSAPYLEPGNGPIATLFFTDSGLVSSGTNPIAFGKIGSYDEELLTYAGAYVPEVVDGFLSMGCCLPPSVGDCDQSGSVDISDISVFIDNQFLTLTPLVCESEGDMDFNGFADITDLSILIDNQFLTLTPLPPCP